MRIFIYFLFTTLKSYLLLAFLVIYLMIVGNLVRYFEINFYYYFYFLIVFFKRSYQPAKNY